MEKSIISFIWRYSKEQQFKILLLTLLSFPVLYMTLELPKRIINDAISQPDIDHNIYGIGLSPVQYLLFLSCLLLTLVILNGLLKMRINIYKGTVGERLVRRLRYMLIERTIRFPLQQFSRVSQGEIIATVVSETKPLADFSADSVALPLYMGGTFVTILLFMFMQNWALGLASIALMPLQMYIIPKLQKKINKLKIQRVLRVRALSQRLGESVAGIQEIRVHGTQRYTLAEYSYRLGQIYRIRLQIFNTKFLMKFLNNTIGQLTPFFFYSVGGILVIRGEVSIGALVAALAAYKDILDPWKELLNYYQRYHDALLRYAQIVQQFEPAGLLSYNPPHGKELFTRVAESFRINNLSKTRDNGDQIFSAINMTVNPGEVVGIIAPQPAIRNNFARTIALLEPPDSGSVFLGNKNSQAFSEPQLRRRIGYIGPELFIFNAAISYNLSYGLNHSPPSPDELSKEINDQLRESKAAGNSTDWFDESFDSVWTDYNILGKDDWKSAQDLIAQVVKVAGGGESVYAASLREKFNPYQLESTNFDDVPDLLLAARKLTRTLIHENNLQHLVEHFDKNAFNPFATMAENLLFGTIGDEGIDVMELARQPEMEQSLVDAMILSDVMSYAQRCLDLILRIYENLPINDRLVTRLELYNEERINALKKLQIQLADSELSNIQSTHKVQLIAFFLNLKANDLRRIEISDQFKQGIIKARQLFSDNLPVHIQNNYYKYLDDKYNPGLSVIDNLLFSRIDTSNAAAFNQLLPIVSKAIDETGLKPILTVLFFLHSQAGIGGSRLPEQARHRITLARSLLKRPDTLIMHDALTVLNHEDQAKVINNMREFRPEMGILWINQNRMDHLPTDRIYHLSEQGMELCTDETGKPNININLHNKNNPELALIRKLEFFAPLNRPQADLLAMRSQIVKVSQGSIIHRMGSEATQAHVLIDGSASLYASDNDKRQPLISLNQYQVTGELEILSHGRHPQSLIADSDCEFLCINGEVLRNLIENNHQLAINFLKNTANKLATMAQNT